MRALGVLVVAFAGASANGCSRSRAQIAAPVELASAVSSAPASPLPADTEAAPPLSIAVPSVNDASAPLAVNHAPGCDILIEALLDANVYRGTPASQMKYDSYRRDPNYARFARSADHGAHYLACKWRVRVNGVGYRYERASHGGPAMGELHAELCSEPAEAEATAKDIATFTDRCQDLHRAEYYGDFLIPDEPAGANK
jgi:hypothetical protein